MRVAREALVAFAAPTWGVLALIPALGACGQRDTGGASLSPVGVWEPLWWRDPAADTYFFRVNWGRDATSHEVEFYQRTTVLQIAEAEDPPAASDGPAANIQVREAAYYHECHYPWAAAAASTVSVPDTSPAPVLGTFDGDHSLFVETYGFDGADNAIDLRCELDGPQALVCTFTDYDGHPPFGFWPEGRFEFRRRASLAVFEEPFLCDRLLERYLLASSVSP